MAEIGESLFSTGSGRSRPHAWPVDFRVKLCHGLHASLLMKNELFQSLADQQFLGAIPRQPS